MISVVIPTRGRGDFSKLIDLLRSLEQQTLQAEEILIIIDFDIPKKPLLHAIKESKLRLHSMQILNQDGYRLSAARNWGVKQAQWDYILLCDDDILLQDEYCLENLYEEYHMKPVHNYSDLLSNVWDMWNPHWGHILYPTITFHDTGKIQTQWFISYNWLLCWPVPKYGIEWKSKFRKWLPVSWVETQPRYGDVQLIWSICIFGSKSTFLNYPYDERFVFIYEDLERSYRMYRAGVALYVSKNITVQHWENDKNMLAWSYIDTPDHVYLKTRHRIRFALKHAQGLQLLLFYTIGFWVSNAWTLLYIMLYGRRKNKLIQSWWKGIADWLAYEKFE